MKILKLRAFFYIFFPLMFVHTCYAIQNSSIIILKGNWQYKWGDSPVDAKGKPLWINHSDNDTTWESINRPSDFAMVPGATDLWISKRLGNYNIDNPAIFISRVEKIFEVYLGDKKIYTFGEFKPDKKIPLMGSAWHLIKLPDDYSGKMITFHIRTDYNYVGTYGEIRLGSIETFLTNMVKNNFDKAALGVVFIFSGIIFFIILIFLGNLKSLLGLIIFQVSTGIWILANTELTLILINVPTLLFYADHIALFSSAIGFFMFAEEIIELKFKTIIKYIVQLYLLYLLLAVIIDIVTYPDTGDMVAPFLVLSAINGLVLIYCLIVSSRTGNREAKILLLALATYTAFVLADIVNYFNNVVMSKGVYEIQYAHYGGLCFYILLCLIIILRYKSVNEQNITAKEEILKNQQRALEAVRNEKAAQEQFAHNLINSQESERKRIAGELHDSLGQELLIIKNRALLGLENNCDDEMRRMHLNEISSLSSQAINEVRQITYNLRPFQLDRIGLTKALQSLITRLELSSEIKFKVFVDNIDNCFPPDSEINIFRIVQEGFNNVIKHSGASSAVFMISKEDSGVCITIEDNGKGFSPASTGNAKNDYAGFGLTGINERSRILGGVCEINSTPGKGSVLKIRLPVRDYEKRNAHVNPGE